MESEHHRIVVTGLGAVTALGIGCQPTWEHILSGRCGISRVKAWDTGPYRTDYAGEIQDFEPLDHFGFKQARRLDRGHQLGIVAAREAVADSGLVLDDLDLTRVGIVIGTSLGGMVSGQKYDKALVTKGRYLRSCLYRYPFQVCADVLTAEFGFVGPRSIISTACTASTIAIGQAIDLIRAGKADIILTGGMDPLAEFSFAGFNCMQNVSSQPCAPFSEPVGLNTGEGAGMLILERLDDAKARGARIYAELLGSAFNADAYHATSSDPSGRSQSRMLIQALEESGRTGDDVDYINAHGTGTAGNDMLESRLIRLVFGERAAEIPVSSTKGALGHCLGATGAIEAVLTVLAVRNDMVPPTVNFKGPRAGCTLDYVPNQSRKKKIHVAISQNFAFGGNNACLVIGKADEPADQGPTHSHTLPGGEQKGWVALPGEEVKSATGGCYSAKQRSSFATKHESACGGGWVSRRVVITGMGLLTPIGCGKGAFLDALRAGADGIHAISRFDTSGLTSHRGGVIETFNSGDYSRADARRMDRLGQFTVCAAELACKDAGIKITRNVSERMGIITGTGQGPIASCKAFHRELALGHPEEANPGVFPNTVCNAATGLAAINLRIRGCNGTVTIGEASGLGAITYGYELIRKGAADVLICGGADQLERCVIEACSVARVISPHVRGPGSSHEEISCPFDRGRNGMILGEGVGLVVLETLESARARDAAIYGEILGWHSGADLPVRRGKDPSGESVARCMRRALEYAHAQASDIGYVAAAGMSDSLYDLVEAKAINEVFGPRRVPVSALSSVTGISSATGSMALCAALLGMQAGFIPSGLNTVHLDPECDLDIISGGCLEAQAGTALINSMSLGGTNVCLVVRRTVEDG